MDWETRIQQIEDRLAISELRAKYCYYADTHDWDALANLFTEDAEFSGGLTSGSGRAAIRASLSTLPQTTPQFWHFVHNEVTELHGDTATGKAMYEFPCVQNGVSYVCAGQWDDVYARVDGLWRFQRRRISFYYFQPLPDDWAGQFRSQAAPAPAT